MVAWLKHHEELGARLQTHLDYGTKIARGGEPATTCRRRQFLSMEDVRRWPNTLEPPRLRGHRCATVLKRCCACLAPCYMELVAEQSLSFPDSQCGRMVNPLGVDRERWCTKTLSARLHFKVVLHRGRENVRV